MYGLSSGGFVLLCRRLFCADQNYTNPIPDSYFSTNKRTLLALRTSSWNYYLLPGLLNKTTSFSNVSLIDLFLLTTRALVTKSFSLGLPKTLFAFAGPSVASQTPLKPRPGFEFESR